MNVVGKSVFRRDGWAKVTGRAKYTDDFFMPGMLHAKVKHSDIAAGRVLEIDTAKARVYPGVVAVYTYEDVPDTVFATAGHPWMIGPENPDVMDRLILTGDIKCYQDDIAVVVAESELIAEQALALISIKYEEYAPITNGEDALRPDAREIVPGSRNTIRHTEQKLGDPELSFKESEVAFESRYTTQMVQHCAMENHIAYSYFGEDGKLTVVSSTQVPHICRRIIGQALDIPWGSIRVIKPFVGGGFGSKQDIVVEALAAFLTKKLHGRPVKVAYDRHETFVCTRVRHPVTYTVKGSVSKSGKLESFACEAITTGGGYASHAHACVAKPGNLLRALYPVKNYYYGATSTYTNTPTAGAMRGYGMPQAIFMLEAAMDDMAARIGLDPIEFRLKNLVENGFIDPLSKVRYNSIGAKECLHKGAELIRWESKKAENQNFNRQMEAEGKPLRRGVGMAAFIYNTATFPNNAELAGARILMNQDASVQLQVGATDIGQGSDTVLAQIAAEIIGIPYDQVYVISTQDTDITPYDAGAYASRQTFVSGKAVKQAAFEVRRKIETYAESYLKIPAAALDVRAGKVVYKHSGEEICPLSQIVMECFYNKNHGRQIFAESSLAVENNPLTYGACFTNLEVDLCFGKINILEIYSIHDSGVIINPALAEAQVHGGISMGLGYAMSEELLVDMQSGKVLNGNLLDYKLPTIVDTPLIHTAFIEKHEATGAFGNKSLGECPTVAVAPAVRNALLAATGMAINSLPLNPQKILKAVKTFHGKQGDYHV